jgi:hypothetical protein
MSVEITDTVNKYANQELPDGTRTYKVVEVTKKYGKNGGEFFIWKLAYEGGVGEQVLLPNMMGELLRVLKCEETEPNKFRWDTNEQSDKTFTATVSHKPDAKDASKIRQHMGEFAPF